MFESKVTQRELEEKLHAFAEALGLAWYHNIEEVSGQISARRVEPQPYAAEVRALREDLSLVMKHLGIKIDNGKRVVVKEKGQKNATHTQTKS